MPRCTGRRGRRYAPAAPDEPVQPDIQGELARARHWILAGDYALGVGQLAAAASAAPADADVEDLLDIVVDELGRQALETVTYADPEHPSPGEVAVQARFLRAAGKGQEAIARLLPLVRADPGRGWLRWFARWIEEDPGLALSSGDFTEALGAFLDRAHPVPPGVELADVVVAAARAIEGDRRDGPLRSSALALRAGRAGDAVRWAEAGERLAPTATSAAQLGRARRAAGDEAGAFGAFEAASERAPEDVSYRLEAGDSLAARGECDGAATWAASAWALDPESGPAAARTLSARYRGSGEARHALELFAWLEARLDGGAVPEALGDAAAFAGGLSAALPWTGHIPVPANAVVGLVGQLRATAAEQRRGPLAVALRSPEAPSALLALRHALGRRLAVTVDGVPTPDPRVPRRPVRTASWALTEEGLAPAPPPPSPRTLAALQLTSTPWYRFEIAARDGARLAAAAGTINDLVALALHPQAGPDGVAPWDWVRRWQVVSCVALAERDAFDVLCDLADGPEDWVCDAALAGLVHLAGRRPDQRARVIEFANAHLVESFNRMASAPPAYLGSECDLFDLLPGRPDDDAEAARAVKRQWAERGGGQ